ncbi:MAG: M56 family metallopeptidase [Candidatus Eiseniibacteriota bacterium]
MERILETLAMNGLAAAVIALPAFLAARRGKHAVAHVLWVLVFAKLLVPAAVGVRVLPERPLPRYEASSPVSAAIGPLAVLATPAGPPHRDLPRPLRLAPALLLLWAAGALTVLSIVTVRSVRFRRLLGRAGTTVPEGQVLRVARRLGLRSAPRVRLVAAMVPPSLWPGPPCEILVPAALWHALGSEQRDALLAHELAHVRRRDHWVRPLELVATALAWWYPLTWWARGQLRASEEACCDALVLRAAGTPPRAYAGALIETLSFLARTTSRPVPALATGAGDFSRIHERLTMILRRQIDLPPSRATRAGLFALALGVLLFGPAGTSGGVTEAARPAAPPAPPAPPAEPTTAAPAAPEAPPAHEAPLMAEPPVPAPGAPGTPIPFGAPALLPTPRGTAWAAELEELQRREIELQDQIEEIANQRARLELQMQEGQLQSEALRVQHEAQELGRQGREAEAKLLREQLALFEAQLSLHRAQVEATEAHRRTERELRDKARELERLYGDPTAPEPPRPR